MSPRSLRSPVAALLAAAVLLLPAAAHAAYAPRLAVTASPSTPDTATALTTVVTQAGGETASRRVRLRLPANFGPASGTQLTPCSDEQKSARACPESSRMGAARAQTSAGAFTGTVNYGPVSGQGIRFFILLSNGIALLDQTIEGLIVVTPTGFETILDGLPDVSTTSFELRLEGPPRSLLKTPRDCGTYAFRAEFTSQRDETASQEVPVAIGPCKNRPPRVDDVTARKGVVRFTLSKAAPGTVEVKRGKRVVARRAFDGVAGVNRVRVAKRLRHGRYRVVVRAADAQGGRGIASGTLRVR